MKKIIIYALLIISALQGFQSCTPDSDIPGAGTSGTARVKILQATRQSLFYAPFTDVKTIQLFSVRRDENSPAGIDKSVNIVLEAIPDSVYAYDSVNAADYEVLPDSLYTLADNGVTKDGNTITIPLASKSIGNELTILMDGSKWDVTHKYAMYYKITDPAGLTPTTNADYIFVTIEAKNEWDGVYSVEGTLSDSYSPSLGNINLYLNYDNQYADPPMQIELRTISPTKCVCYDNYFYGGYYKAISVNNGDGSFDYSAYGDFCAIFEFDPETNAIVSVTNYYGQPAPSNTRSAELDPSGENMYDASTGNFNIKYWMNQPSLIPDPPFHRTSFDEKWTYIGERE